ncbi:hypothetical protein TNIN_257411 [Trichonephila inaurata madagascariensis]|uniref:Uncharacterized protein n=1 Tax=Trichonephila inaurata madagascariensis TaxID=2747483 RepID=A0A8X6MIU7_9ARAC|nr:hypothetical protein TNIN_257411 [Trichonephila inaurata madagascariensis]
MDFTISDDDVTFKEYDTVHNTKNELSRSSHLTLFELSKFLATATRNIAVPPFKIKLSLFWPKKHRDTPEDECSLGFQIIEPGVETSCMFYGVESTNLSVEDPRRPLATVSNDVLSC